MSPDPDQVHIHHRRSAEIVGEEIGADIAVEAQEHERRGQDRETGDDQDVRAERGPGEDRSEEHTSARQSPIRTSYAVFCLKKPIHYQIPNIYRDPSHYPITGPNAGATASPRNSSTTH